MKQKQMDARNAVIIFISYLFLSSCGGGSQQSALKPSSIGSEYEVVVIVDNANTNDPHVKALQDVLNKQYPMLNQPEPWFNIKWINISDFDASTQKFRNIIFLDNTHLYGEMGKVVAKIFNTQSTEKLKTDEDKFYILGKNIWAEPQEFMYLAAEKPDELAEKIKNNADNILNHFDQKEFNRLKSRLFQYRERKDLEDELINQRQVKIRLPEIFERANYSHKNQDSINTQIGINSFDWFYTDTKKAFSNVLIYSQNYTDSQQLSIQNIINQRDSVCKYYIPCSVKNSYMATETRYPELLPKSETIELNGYFAIKTVGYWKAVNDFMGGPFVHYTIVDEKHGRIISLDGNVFAPNEPKKKFIQRIKAILTTVEII